MITDLRTELKTKLDTHFTNRVYFAEAPRNPTLPYATITELPGNRDRDSVDVFSDVFIQINGYSKTLTELETKEVLVNDTLDYKHSTFTLTDYYVIEIELKQFRTTKLDVRPDGIYQFSHTYKVNLQKK